MGATKITDVLPSDLGQEWKRIKDHLCYQDSCPITKRQHELERIAVMLTDLTIAQAALAEKDAEIERLNLRTHKWTGRQVGGHPANAESYEWVRFCDLCGMEDTCEDVPPCPVTREDLAAHLAEAERTIERMKGALQQVRSGVMLMVPEPQKSGFLKIIDAAQAPPAEAKEGGQK